VAVLVVLELILVLQEQLAQAVAVVVPDKVTAQLVVQVLLLFVI
jgi:hypothetical protein